MILSTHFTFIHSFIIILQQKKDTKLYVFCQISLFFVSKIFTTRKTYHARLMARQVTYFVSFSFISFSFYICSLGSIGLTKYIHVYANVSSSLILLLFCLSFSLYFLSFTISHPTVLKLSYAHTH